MRPHQLLLHFSITAQIYSACDLASHDDDDDDDDVDDDDDDDEDEDDGDEDDDDGLGLDLEFIYWLLLLHQQGLK